MNHTVFLFVAVVALIACPSNRPAEYGDALVKCNKEAATCDESIACENRERAKLGRPLRDPSLGCK